MKNNLTASEELKETFNSLYRGWINYCEWVLDNCYSLEEFEDPLKNCYDEGIPVLDLQRGL